ncbi:MAG: preprotein translocase subunit SecG [Alphaproteobacteria bacterium]|nr:preprotein translocase subunit SecG [Alphaproteobacteria bacterium]
MQAVVLVIHFLIAAFLIGLVLLQRSEGGALGMGGGGGNAMMSGRGAANALVRMTTVLGALFFATSLGLTVLSGYEARNQQRQLNLDVAGAVAPAETAAPAEEAIPVSAPAATESPTAPSPDDAKTFAAPISSAPPPAAAPRQPAPRTSAPASTPPRTQPRTQPARTEAPAALPVEVAPRTAPAETPPESRDDPAPDEPVRRRPAGPDQ